MENQVVIQQSERNRLVPVLVAVLGVPVAGIQVLTGLGHFLALWFARDLRDAIPNSPPLDINGSDYLRAAGYASVNLALAAVCVVAIIVAFKPSRHGPTTRWVCLGLVVIAALTVVTVTALSTFTDWNYFDEVV